MATRKKTRTRKNAGALSYWQRQALKDQARAALESFIRSVSPCKFAGREKHFQAQFERYFPGKPEPTEGLTDHLEAFFRILEALARDKTPAGSDLDSLTEALNHPINQSGGIRLRGPAPDAQISGVTYPPYRPKFWEGLRRPGELLLEYLNTTFYCGILHTICARPECGRMAMKWRGGKKYCSKECRDARWSYAARQAANHGRSWKGESNARKSK